MAGSREEEIAASHDRSATLTPSSALASSDDGSKQVGDIELGGTSNDLEYQQHPQETRSSSSEQARELHPTWSKEQIRSTSDHTNPQYLPAPISKLFQTFFSLPVIRPVTNYIRGPPLSECRTPRLWKSPAILVKLELFLVKTTRPFRYPWTLWVFLLAWFLGMTFLTRAAWFNSSTGDVTWLSGTSTFFTRNDGCGLNGDGCGPFEDSLQSYRCPSKVASTRLLNYRTIGLDEVIYQPLVVGGGDADGTYRADSFICAAAVHHGVFSDSTGGCLSLRFLADPYTDFIGSTSHGIPSVSFPSEFPFAFRFEPTSQTDCRDLRNDMLIFETIMSAAFGLLFRTSAGIFYWVSVCFGYWHITLASDPREFPPDLAGAFGTFLPTLFICYVFYRAAFRWVLPAFNDKIWERTILFLGPFWVFLLSNYTLDKLPIDRLTASDIKQQAGGIAAVVVLALVLLVIIVNQFRMMRLTGWLPWYLGWYAVGGLVVLVSSQLPGLTLRIHHYILAMVLIPLTAFPTRPALIYQGILLGLFLNGAARWGFDSILQTPSSLLRDAALGSDLPSFNLTSFSPSSPDITWSAIPSNLTSSWDGFALIINDVLRYTSGSDGTNFSMATAEMGGEWRTDIPYYLRLAYQSGGVSGDFTKAATVWLANGTFVSPESGPS